MLWLTVFGDIRVRNQIILFNSTPSRGGNQNLLPFHPFKKEVGDPNYATINHHFLKECSENFQMKYVNCFNRLRFLAEVSTNLLKIHFSRQIKGLELRKETWNLDKWPHFSSTFSTLFVTLIFVFENSQNSFSCEKWHVK